MPNVLGLGADGSGNDGGSLTNNPPGPLPQPPSESGRPMVDGVRDGLYSAPLALQTVQTGFGDNLSELDALYAVVVSNDLYLFISGNLENNYNKLNIFIDSIPGGQQTIDASQNPNNDDWAARHDGFTFDDGFSPDFAFNFRQGSAIGVAPAFFDFTVVGGGSRDYDLYVSPFTSGSNTGYGTTPPGANLGYVFELGFNNSNTGGVTSGSGAADPVAARSVSTGFELRIPLDAIGQPPPGSRIRLVAMVNGRYHDFLSNQILPGFVPPQGNLGGDGRGNFTGTVGGIDLRDFEGTQFAEIVIPDTSLIRRWTETSAPIADWTAVACSADGTKLVAVVQNGPIYISVDAGRTWTQTSAPTNEVWSTVASSADGNTLVAAGFPGPIYVSRDAGATWTQTSAAANHFWAWVACSADGTRIAAVPYGYGSTVGSVAAPETEGGDRIALAIDDGIVIPPGFPGFPLPPFPSPSVSAAIYLSSDAGTTWSSKNPIPSSSGFADFRWTSVAMSEDGNKLLATGIGWEPVYIIGIPVGYTTRGFVYGSGNGGGSWSNLGGNGSLWNWVAMARGGSDMLLAGGSVSISRNEGSTWEGMRLPPGNWFSVESSADGTRMTAAEWPNQLYPGRIASSIDSGATWDVDAAPDTQWNGVAMSADGSLAVAPVYRGRIWVSRMVPVIWTPPVGMHVNEGESVEFSVEVESSVGPDFQWLFDGMAIPGARSATLVLTNVQPAQAGVYAVVVSNRLGSVTSSNALLQVNRYPIARGIATPNPAISSNGTNAVVVLDASRSSDPDGDALTHTWYSYPQSGGSTGVVTVATGAVAVTSLPVGTNLLWLLVDDGIARDGETVTVAVLTTAQAVESLISRVTGSDLPRPRPFLATLEEALASIQRGNCHSALGQLHAFQNKVQAQVSRDAAGLTTELIRAADEVIAALDCDGSPNVVAKIHSLKRHPNGSMGMKIKGEAGKAYVLEASTNLVDWTCICVVRPDAKGNCDYEDVVADKHPCRFYRIVEP